MCILYMILSDFKILNPHTVIDYIGIVLCLFIYGFTYICLYEFSASHCENLAPKFANVFYLVMFSQTHRIYTQLRCYYLHSNDTIKCYKIFCFSYMMTLILIQITYIHIPYIHIFQDCFSCINLLKISNKNNMQQKKNRKKIC